MAADRMSCPVFAYSKSVRIWLNDPVKIVMARNGDYTPEPMDKVMTNIFQKRQALDLANQAAKVVLDQGSSQPGLEDYFRVKNFAKGAQTHYQECTVDQLTALRIHSLNSPAYFHAYAEDLYQFKPGGSIEPWADFMCHFNEGIKNLAVARPHVGKLFRIAQIPDQVWDAHFQNRIGEEVYFACPMSAATLVQQQFIKHVPGHHCVVLTFNEAMSSQAACLCASSNPISIYGQTEDEWTLRAFTRGIIAAIRASIYFCDGNQIPEVEIVDLLLLPVVPSILHANTIGILNASVILSLLTDESDNEDGILWCLQQIVGRTQDAISMKTSIDHVSVSRRIRLFISAMLGNGQEESLVEQNACAVAMSAHQCSSTPINLDDFTKAELEEHGLSCPISPSSRTLRTMPARRQRCDITTTDLLASDSDPDESGGYIPASAGRQRFRRGLRSVDFDDMELHGQRSDACASTAVTAVNCRARILTRYRGLVRSEGRQQIRAKVAKSIEDILRKINHIVATNDNADLHDKMTERMDRSAAYIQVQLKGIEGLEVKPLQNYLDLLEDLNNQDEGQAELFARLLCQNVLVGNILDGDLSGDGLGSGLIDKSEFHTLDKTPMRTLLHIGSRGILGQASPGELALFYLDTLRIMLASTRIITVMGAPGIGKSSLLKLVYQLDVKSGREEEHRTKVVSISKHPELYTELARIYLADVPGYGDLVGQRDEIVTYFQWVLRSFAGAMSVVWVHKAQRPMKQISDDILRAVGNIVTHVIVTHVDQRIEDMFESHLTKVQEDMPTEWDSEDMKDVVKGKEMDVLGTSHRCSAGCQFWAALLRMGLPQSAKLALYR